VGGTVGTLNDVQLFLDEQLNHPLMSGIANASQCFYYGTSSPRGRRVWAHSG
jgi:hypothetical protein